MRAADSARRPWSHYLARPGYIEAIGRTKWSELAESLADPQPAVTALDLNAVAGRATDDVQHVGGGPAGSPRLRSARTRLRWVARVDPDGSGPPRVRFVVHRDEVRLLRLTVASGAAAGLAAACEDVALHDWLLSTLIEVIRKAPIGLLSRAEVIDRLLPAIDHLLHLWMPGARGDEFTALIWTVLERGGGFSRQWETLVHRIRDQLSVAAVAALSVAIPR